MKSEGKNELEQSKIAIQVYPFAPFTMPPIVGRYRGWQTPPTLHQEIMINRAPVLTLFAAIIIEREGFRPDESISMGSWIAGK